MIDEFARLLKELIQMVSSSIGSTLIDWDKKSYESVVNCLLLKDELAVKEAVDQLVKEGKALAIPPLYLASQKHPKLSVRQYCWDSLEKLDDIHKINRLIQGKNVKEAVEVLISEYGHFATDYY